MFQFVSQIWFSVSLFHSFSIALIDMWLTTFCLCSCSQYHVFVLFGTGFQIIDNFGYNFVYSVCYAAYPSHFWLFFLSNVRGWRWHWYYSKLMVLYFALACWFSDNVRFSFRSAIKLPFSWFVQFEIGSSWDMVVNLLAHYTKPKTWYYYRDQ